MSLEGHLPEEHSKEVKHDGRSWIEGDVFCFVSENENYDVAGARLCRHRLDQRSNEGIGTEGVENEENSDRRRVKCI